MPIQSSTHFLGILGVLAASLLWGTTGTAAAFAPEVSAAAIAAAAMGGGGLLQALRGLPLIRRNRALLKRHSALLLSAGLSVALYPIAFYGSMRLAGVTLGTVISIGAAPLFSGAIEWAAEGKAPGVRWGAGVAAGIIGILLITLESGAETASGTALHPVAGVLAALAAAFTYAYYSYAARRLMLSGIPSRAAMGAEFGIGALLLLPVLLATRFRMLLLAFIWPWFRCLSAISVSDTGSNGSGQAPLLLFRFWNRWLRRCLRRPYSANACLFPPTQESR